MSAARGFARNKPIIVLKPGRYAESARAALSHTGSMAGGDEIYEAAFRREGVVRVHEVADLFHAAAVLDSHRLPKGRDVAIVTNAGGLGVMATDSLVEHGGRLAPLSETTMAALDAALPPYWSHANPIDVLGDAGSDRFVAAVTRMPRRRRRQRHPAHLHAAGKRTPRRDGRSRSPSSSRAPTSR